MSSMPVATTTATAATTASLLGWVTCPRVVPGGRTAAASAGEAWRPPVAPWGGGWEARCDLRSRGRSIGVFGLGRLGAAGFGEDNVRLVSFYSRVSDIQICPVQ